MPNLPFEIRHGKFLDILGTPVKQEEITFVPAEVELHGTSFSPLFPLSTWCQSNGTKLPPVLHGEENAPWVLGRLMALFHTENTPEEERGEKCCLCASFLAILPGEIAIPFTCSDIYGQTSLYFSSEDEPSEAHQAQIASAFYNLLLSEPDELVDYSNRMYHPGSGSTFSFGVENGEPYMDEEIE